MLVKTQQVLKFSNFFGNAGINASGAESNFFGQNAGYLATTRNSNFFGGGAGYQQQMLIRQISLVECWYGATNAYSSNFFGYQAGSNAIGANDSNFFGNNAGDYAANAYASNFFGAQAGSSSNCL
jgi:hypothetical protein